MKKQFLWLLLTGLLLIYGCAEQSMSRKSQIEPDTRDRLLNTGWRFIRDSLQGPESPGFDDSGWMTVDLPHDYSMMDLPGGDGPDQIGPFSRKSPGNGNSTGHVIGGTGWYRKSFILGKKDSGKTVILKFDGVYMYPDTITALINLNQTIRGILNT